jgi:hypothetical protein
MLAVNFVLHRGLSIFVMLVVMFLMKAVMLAGSGFGFVVRGMLFVMRFFGAEAGLRRFLVMFLSASQGLSREQFDRGVDRWRQSRRRGVRMVRWMAVIVVFEILENVADVEEGVAVQADVHESGLHAGKDACDFSFVDAADEREFLLAFDVDFD